MPDPIIEPYVTPFTILIDSAEGQPFTFQGISADADKDNRPIAVKTLWKSLGKYPRSLGDYSIDGMVGRVHVERKSMEDCQSTVMGWENDHQKEKGLPSRRERFKQELENLSNIENGCVVVEASLGDCLRHMPEWGTKPVYTNRKIFHRSIISFMQEYDSVPWFFCDTRRLAEITTFRYLERFWKKHWKESEL